MKEKKIAMKTGEKLGIPRMVVEFLQNLAKERERNLLHDMVKYGSISIVKRTTAANPAAD